MVNIKPSKDVDDYIAHAPKEIQATLEELRQTIRNAAPDAVEKISYSMPYYAYKGRLAYFQVTKNHIGLYVPPPVIQEHKNELKDFNSSTGTVRFPYDKKLPTALITKLILARVKINDAIKN